MKSKCLMFSERESVLYKSHYEESAIESVYFSARRTNERGSPESLGLERMPAEMYVPNQEQWLELRAPKRYNFCCTE